jgi:hypothetical protein
MLAQLFARHFGRRRVANRRHRAAARHRMLGEMLEPRSMLAVSASVLEGTLNIALDAAGDAAFLSYDGSAYTLTDGAGAAVTGSPFSGVTTAVSVAGTVAANQSFTFGGSTALPVSLGVESNVEATTISQAITASTLAGSVVTLSSPAITLAADISTAGAQTYAGAVLLAGSPSLISTGGAVSFQNTVDTYFGVGFAPQAAFATGSRPFSVATGDLNGDGKPDLAIANVFSYFVSVLLNTTAPGATTPSYAPQGTFATGSRPYSVSIGDFNGDGKPDLAVANYRSDSVSVLLNTTAPGATTPSYAPQETFATGSRPYSVSIGDLNGDGKPDLAIANLNSNSVSVLLNTTEPGATAPSYAAQTTFATNTPGSVSIGDLNGDGKPDLAIANVPSNSVSVLLNTTEPGATAPSYAAQATFATGKTPISVSIGDLNGDGRPDLAIANAGLNVNSVSVLLNTTAPGATTPSYASQATFATGVTPNSVAIGDLNGDGKPDLAIANGSSDSVSVLVNTTAPGATTPSYANQATFATGDTPRSVSIGDFNGDGKPDLAVANMSSNSSNSVSVLLNATLLGPPSGAISPQSTFATGSGSFSVSMGDLNGDGKPDLAIANAISNSVSVLLNTTAPGATAPSYASQATFATGTRPYSVSIGDLNGDGKPDLAITNAFSDSMSVLLNTMAPGATTPSYASQATFATGIFPRSVAIGDMNGDGQPDLAIANYGSNSVSVLLNTTAPGATTPSYAPQATFAAGNSPFSVSTGDLNGDGQPDLAIANFLFPSNSVSVLLNTTAPGATTPSYSPKATFATGGYPYSVSIGDMNGDGKPDLAIANRFSDSVSVLLNTTAPGATTPSYAPQATFATGDSPTSVSIGDLNGDGKPDLAIANRFSDSVSVLLNTTAPGATTPSYAPQATFATGDSPRSVSIGDMNGDGKPDLAVANSVSNSVSALLNATASGNLTVSSATGTTFAATVGGTTPLASVTIASGPTSLGGNVTTSGTQAYAGAVTLAADAAITTAGGAVTFAQAVDGGKNLTITAGDGTVNFANAVGGAAPLGSLWVYSAGSVTAAARIALDGAVAGARPHGLALGANVKNVTMTAAGSTIRNFGGHGIVLDSVKGSSLAGFLVGDNAAGGALATGDLAGTVISGSFFKGNPTGVLLSSARGLTIGKGNYLMDGTSSGLAAYGDSKGSVVTGSVFYNNAMGILLSNATDLTIDASSGMPNSILSNTAIGIAVSGACSGTSITGVSASGNPTGILLSAAQGVTVGNGNYFVNGTSSGLAAYGDSAGSVMTGSVFHGNGIGMIVSGATSLAINASGGTPNALVSNTHYGIFVDGSCDGSEVSGNTIAFNSAGVVLSGARNLTVDGGNYIGLNTNTGVFVTGDSSGTKLEGNVIDRNATGLLMSAAAGLTVGGAGAASNTIANSVVGGVMLMGACTGSTLGANWIGLNGTGILLSGASGATFSGASTVANNTFYGLYAGGDCGGTSVTGGSFVSNESGLVIVAAEGLSISGTTVVGNSGHGLWATGKCTGTSIVGNTISGNGTNIETSTTTGGTFQTS